MLRLTAVTGCELRVGTDVVDRCEEILPLSRMCTLPVSLPAALRAGEVDAPLRARGEPSGCADCLQVGVCLHHDLATRNQRHFGRVDGLQTPRSAGGLIACAPAHAAGVPADALPPAVPATRYRAVRDRGR